MAATLTKAERAEVNRRNAKKSTGPRTAIGKAVSKMNALKHGMRARVRVLPGEDPEAVDARYDAWNDDYRPRTSAAQHLVNECARATLMADRVHRFHDEAVAHQMRNAEAEWLLRRDDQVQAVCDGFHDAPEATMRALRRTAAGCRRMLRAWAEMRRELEAGHELSAVDREKAVLLLGLDRSQQLTHPEGWLLHYHCSALSDYPMPGLFSPGVLPAHLAGRYTRENMPTREEARAWLIAWVDAAVAALSEREELLRTTVEEPDRLGAAARASILTDPHAGRIYLRYESETRNSFHRAFAALSRVIEEENAGLEVEPEPEPEPTPAPKSAPEVPAQPDLPNEANFDITIGKAEACEENPGARPARPAGRPGVRRGDAPGRDAGPARGAGRNGEARPSGGVGRGPGRGPRMSRRGGDGAR